MDHQKFSYGIFRNCKNVHQILRIHFRINNLNFSQILLAVSDANYKLIYVDCGSYGGQGDANVFASSAFKKIIEAESFDVPTPCLLPRSNVQANYFFVGDSAFPLTGYLIKPFIQVTNLSPEKRIYNYR